MRSTKQNVCGAFPGIVEKKFLYVGASRRWLLEKFWNGKNCRAQRSSPFTFYFVLRISHFAFRIIRSRGAFVAVGPGISESLYR
jgi:hypothetical protein